MEVAANMAAGDEGNIVVIGIATVAFRSVAVVWLMVGSDKKICGWD